MASSSQDVPTTASSSNDGLHSSSTAAPAFGTPVISSSRRRDGRPIPHDILLPIARYLGDMCKAGDHDARLTLASMMRVSSDAFDAAARTLYAAVTVSRDSFSQVFGGNDTKKSNMFGHPITFPTRASVVRKLGLFQYTRHLHLHDLPSEQAVDDLIDAWRVACSQPASGVSCREALHGNLFPRIECVSFGPGVFLNHHSAPPLGPENGGLHRFLSFLRRESSPKHMCMAYPTPAQVMAYQQEHPAAERSSGWGTPAPIADPAPGPLGVGAGPPVLLAGPVVHESRLSRADEAAWPEILARIWRIKTITIHNMRFSRAAARCLVKLPCEQLRIFALDSVCGHGICAERECFHSDTRWGRAGTMLHTMARDDKDVARFAALEIANVGAGFPLTCNCSAEYSNAVAWLKTYLRDRADEAPWSLALPHWSQAAPCQCCGAAVAPTGDTGEGSARGIIHPNRNCFEDVHRWEKGFRPSESTAAVVPIPGGGGPLIPLTANNPFFVPQGQPLPPHLQQNPAVQPAPTNAATTAGNGAAAAAASPIVGSWTPAPPTTAAQHFSQWFAAGPPPIPPAVSSPTSSTSASPVGSRSSSPGPASSSGQEVGVGAVAAVPATLDDIGAVGTGLEGQAGEAGAQVQADDASDASDVSTSST